MRPIGEDRPEAERLSLVEPEAAALVLEIETAQGEAEGPRIFGGCPLRGEPVFCDTSCVISPSWVSGMTRFSNKARIHRARSCGVETIAPAAPAQDMFWVRTSLPISGARVETLQGFG